MSTRMLWWALVLARIAAAIMVAWRARALHAAYVFSSVNGGVVMLYHARRSQIPIGGCSTAINSERSLKRLLIIFGGGGVVAAWKLH